MQLRKRLAGEALQIGQAPFLVHASHEQSRAKRAFQRGRLGPIRDPLFSTLGRGLHLK